MTDYMLTAWSNGAGWRDIAVRNAPDMHAAIAAAEKYSGCKVSHGRGSIGADFHPSSTLDMATGEVTVHHTRKARPQVVAGPPEVMAPISAALAPARPKQPPAPMTATSWATVHTLIMYEVMCHHCGWSHPEPLETLRMADTIADLHDSIAHGLPGPDEP